MGQSVAVRGLDQLASWNSDWRDLRVAVLGLGVTGFAAADTLVELGASVIVVTSSAEIGRADLLEAIGASLIVEPDRDVIPAGLVAHEPQLVIVSPGFPPSHPLIDWARQRSIPIWGDIELAWRLRDKVKAAYWILVTGTNGKTTTVQLVTHLLAADGRRVAAVGNIGVPVLDAIREPGGFDVLVVELSSFQLHWLPTTGQGALVPLASVCLNLADDHLDWHGSREAYAAAKAKVYANTRIACVYNRADPATRRMVEDAEVAEGCRAIGFGLDAPGPSDLGIVGDIVLDRAFIPNRQSTALELTTHGELAEAGLTAPHTVANLLAASALARAAGVGVDTVRSALATFVIDRHRTEAVASAGGITWVDDSKATNPHAADAALRSFDSVVWIVGGLLKGTDIGEVIVGNLHRLKATVIIGENRQPVVEAFRRHAPTLPVFEVAASQTDEAEPNQVMTEAVRLAAGVATRGDVVLLAPAAASMDQFRDYADRGNRFATAVLIHTGGIAANDDAEPSDPEPIAKPPTGPAEPA
jgi:UDP-N-acetylmuramoylalanine--D-glutamate ligase